MKSITQGRKSVAWRMRPGERYVVLLIGDALAAGLALFGALYFWSLSPKEWFRFSWEFLNTRPQLWFYLLPLAWLVMMVELYDVHRAHRRRETVRGNVKDHSKAVQSIREAGLEGELLTDPKIPQKPLNDNMRDWLASGQAIPEGLDFSVKRYVSVTRK
jgi:hypothetical protein